MKKKLQIKTLILGVIGGILIGSSIGITANYLLKAEDVEYVDKDNNSKTVQSAITDLYSKANGSAKLEEMEIGTLSISGASVSIPYTGDYVSVTCVYGLDEDYGSVGAINNQKCSILGDVNKKYYFKMIATDINGKIYEYMGDFTTGNGTPLSAVNLGDYIYMKPTSQSYTISKDATGCTNTSYCGGVLDQEINPSELEVWRVIRKNANGTVDVISDKVSSTDVYFYGQTGYRKFVETLNSIASQYTNTKFVKSTRHMGYLDQTGNITNTTYLTKTTKPWDISMDGTGWTSSVEPYGGGDMSYQTDVDLVTAVYGDLYAYSADINENGKQSNWISSRFYWNENDSAWRFNLRDSGSVNSGWGMIGFWNNTYHYSSWCSRVRPILTLKSSILIVGGTGISGDEYQLGL